MDAILYVASATDRTRDKRKSGKIHKTGKAGLLGSRDSYFEFLENDALSALTPAHFPFHNFLLPLVHQRPIYGTCTKISHMRVFF